MRIIVSIFSLICISPLLGKLLILDEVMSKEDQQNSGVAYLSPQQRSVLEVWINRNCNCIETSAAEEDTQHLMLSINIQNGRKIQLSDGSIWEVDPRDYTTSQAWLSPIPLKIVPSNDPKYPFLLVNKTTGVSIRVKEATIMPETPASLPATPAPAPAPSAPSPPSAPSGINK